MAGISWSDALDVLWNLAQKMAGQFSNRGIYEVLEYESTLEILSRSGRRAAFSKHKRVRYLQDDVIVYQDHAWGDGDILLNYRSNHGKAVDLYKSGYCTYVLLSLQEVKNRGDADDFYITWGIRGGFLKPDGFWGTDVTQPTRRLKVGVVFPKSRPPRQIVMEECNRRHSSALGPEALRQLPDGRWLACWEKEAPRLHELYVLRWKW